MKGKELLIASGLVLALTLTGAQPTFAANFPLEITNIKAAGSGLDPNNRIFRAYPGIQYSFRAGVIGGAYPFTYSLSNAPSGMTVDGSGTISWPNPQADATVTLTVRDIEGSQVSATWAIDVTTTGFKFVDSTVGSSGNGTLASPWRTMNDVYGNTTAADIVYFRGGTYNQLTLPRRGSGGDWEQVDWTTKAEMWLAYPGTTPRIDFGYRAGVETAPAVRFSGRNIFVDGFEMFNSRNIMFQPVAASGYGFTFIRNVMHDHGPGVNGGNSAFLSISVALQSHAVGSVIAGNTFYNATTGSSSGIQSYTQDKFLIADNTFYNVQDAMQIKGDHNRWEVRGNRIYNITGIGVGGNQNTATQGEVRFNYIRSSTYAMNVNNDGVAGPTFINRNTLVGRTQVRNTTSSNGPFTFTRNVIVNGDSGTPSGSHIQWDNVTDASRVRISENLVGYPSDNIVDASGNLTANYITYRATHGHQSNGSGGSTTPISVPSAPSSVRIIR